MLLSPGSGCQVIAPRSPPVSDQVDAPAIAPEMLTASKGCWLPLDPGWQRHNGFSPAGQVPGRFGKRRTPGTGPSITPLTSVPAGRCPIPGGPERQRCPDQQCRVLDGGLRDGGLELARLRRLARCR